MYVICACAFYVSKAYIEGRFEGGKRMLFFFFLSGKNLKVLLVHNNFIILFFLRTIRLYLICGEEMDYI